MNRFRVLLLALSAMTVLNIVMVFVLKSQKAVFEKHPRHGHEGPRNEIIEKLHFDEEQVAKYDKEIEAHKAEISFLQSEMMNAKKVLYQNLGQFSDSQKDSLIQVIAQAQKDIESVHYDHFLEIKSLCRAEQLNDFDTLTTELSELFNHKPPGRR